MAQIYVELLSFNRFHFAARQCIASISCEGYDKAISKLAKAAMIPMRMEKAIQTPLLPIESPPKYVHLAQRLLRQIAQKNLRPGDYLGTESELAKQHGVSRVTVRQALLVLARDGYISRVKAKGTFIKKAVRRSPRPSTGRGTVVLACSNEQADHADEDFAFAAAIRAIESHLTARGFTSQILGFGLDSVADRKRLRELGLRDDLEGICTIGPCLDPYRDELPDVPIVTSCTYGPNSATWVGSNTRAACKSLVNYLLDHGHRQIALVCSSELREDAFGLLAQAFTEAFDTAGVPYSRQLMYHAYPTESLTKMVEQMLSDTFRPTAIFAENWKVCQIILAVAAEMSIRVPDDVSLVAFGRNVLQITYPLAITAYVPDYKSIGEKTVELLTAVVQGDRLVARQLEITGQLVQRDSVRRIGPSLLPR
jgi:DNA-binding LacI/PurR family transcriptional regulator